MNLCTKDKTMIDSIITKTLEEKFNNFFLIITAISPPPFNNNSDDGKNTHNRTRNNTEEDQSFMKRFNIIRPCKQMNTVVA